MANSTSRTLRLLSRLQARPEWTGPELADELGVTVRTVRRDVERLRQLGYPVTSARGPIGGYRLGSGGRAMPPLMLERDEAVAVAMSLSSTSTSTIAGGGDAAQRALNKLEQLLPPVVRRQVGALMSVTERLVGDGEVVSSDLLMTVSRACRDGERLRVRYRNHGGEERERTLDPHRLVAAGRRWYLVAHDRDRAAWRTYRVDRLADVVTTGHHVELVDPPHAVEFVQRAITTAPYRYQAQVELAAPVSEVAARIPPHVALAVPVDEVTTSLTTGADDLDLLAFHILRLGFDFVVVEPIELREHLGRLAARAARAAVDPDARSPSGSGPFV